MRTIIRWRRDPTPLSGSRVSHRVADALLGRRPVLAQAHRHADRPPPGVSEQILCAGTNGVGFDDPVRVVDEHVKATEPVGDLGQSWLVARANSWVQLPLNWSWPPCDPLAPELCHMVQVAVPAGIEAGGLAV